MPRPIRWLHLSDLHYGCKGKELWQAIEPEFLSSVERMAGDLGPPDLVLLTGDLAFSGKEEDSRTPLAASNGSRSGPELERAPGTGTTSSAFGFRSEGTPPA